MNKNFEKFEVLFVCMYVFKDILKFENILLIVKL